MYRFPKQLILIPLMALTFLFGSLVISNGQQKMDSIERDRLNSMLKGLKDEIKKNYYDPTYHGIDLDARFKQAEERMKQVQTTGQGFAVIAQVLLDFNDSHLFFEPPLTNVDVDYGWRDEMVGDKCYVWNVKPKSDAEAKGLKEGDQILKIEGYPPSRNDLWKMDYYFYTLNKKSSLKITVQSPNSDEPRDLEIKAKVFTNRGALSGGQLSNLYRSTGSDYDKNLFVNVGNITVWKMPSFAIDPNTIESLFERTKDTRELIIDLRGNGGGYVETMERLAGFVLGKELIIAQLKGRKDMDPQKSKPKGRVFTGKLTILLDSRSASASEIFARLVQLQDRGKVVGDVSAGAVMQAKGFDGATANSTVLYGASITNADVMMSDGKSLEHVGVTPDELILPTGEDMAKGRDPVLARAIQLMGGTISAEDAGKLFRYEWKNDQLLIVTK